MRSTTMEETTTAHDWTKPGMSEETREKLKKLTSSQAFAKRVAKVNKKRQRRVSNNPWRSKAKKWLEHYSDDAPNASFTFYQNAEDPGEVAKAMTQLQKLGVGADQLGTKCCPQRVVKVNRVYSRVDRRCDSCKDEARKASAQETT